MQVLTELTFIFIHFKLL